MRNPILRSVLAGLLAAAALACSTEDARPVAGGNAGGSGGTMPGTGGTGGSAGTPGVDAPGWDGLGAELVWRYQGFGEVWSLATGDFVGDGTTQVAVGARRPLLVSADGARVIWFADWEQPEDNLFVGGDNDWVYQLAAVPAEDGRSDLLVTSSMGDAARLDGRTGEAIWRMQPDLRFPFPFFTTFETSSGSAFFPNYGRAAYSLATGEPVWQLPVAAVAAYVREAKRAGGLAGLFVVDEGDRRVGGPGGGAGDIPGKVASTTADGALVFSVDLPAGETPTALGAADLDGSGTSSAIVATGGGPLRAWDGAGELLWETTPVLFDEDPLRGLISQILGRDVDGDGREEILVVARDLLAPDPGAPATLVVALDASGAERWRASVQGQTQSAQIVEWGGEPVLLLGTGVWDLGAKGAVVAVRLADGLEWRTGFRYEMPGQASAFAMQGETLVVGSQDGILRAADHDGDAVWSHYLSAFLSASATLPMGDEDWVITADNSANVALLDATGTRRWFRRLGVGDFGWSVDVTAARLGDTRPSIVAAAKAVRESANGLVEIFSPEGNRKGSLLLPAEPAALAAADLDGDGIDEILVLEQGRAQGEVCQVRAFDAKLAQKWAVATELCQYGELSVADVAGDGTLAIAVRTDPGLLPALPTLSLIGADGALRWIVREELEYSLWARAVPGGLLSGGVTTDRNGFVALREPKKGEMQWKTLLPPKADPANPEGEKLPGASWFAHVLPDGESFRVAATTYTNELVLLDGDGDIAWSVSTEAEPWPLHRRIGGPVVFVPGTERAPPHFVTAQYADSRRRADVVVVSMDGEVKGRVPIAAESHDVLLLRRGGAGPVAVAQALLGMYAVGVAPR